MAEVLVVDRNDEVVGLREFDEALAEGLIRRVARVFLFKGDGEVFLQKRSAQVKVFPGRWDQAAGGHVDKGETYEEAAYRELKEELGLTTQTLKQEALYYCEEKEAERTLRMFNGLFSAQYNGESFTFDKDEVSEGKWFSKVEFRTSVEKNPDQFAPGMVLAWEKLIQHKHVHSF